MDSLPRNFHVASLLVWLSERPNIIILADAFSFAWMTHDCTIVSNRIVLVLVNSVLNFVDIFDTYHILLIYSFFFTYDSNEIITVIAFLDNNLVEVSFTNLDLPSRKDI